MQNTKELRIKYQKAYDFKTSFVSGVHGGLSSNGLITANFFTDRAALPEMNLITVNEKNQLVKVEDIKDSDGIREAQFAVLMDVTTTKLIINWLQSKVNEFEQLNGQNNV